MTKKVTFCGVLVAVSIVLLMMTSIFSLNKLFFACISTLAFPLIVVYFDKKTAVTALLCACILAFVLLPNKMLALFYALLGAYSIVKEIIEKKDRLLVEWIIKLSIYFSCAVTACFILNISIFAKLIVLFGGVAIFVVYDIALSICIPYCMNYVRKIKH